MTSPQDVEMETLLGELLEKVRKLEASYQDSSRELQEEKRQCQQEVLALQMGGYQVHACSQEEIRGGRQTRGELPLPVSFWRIFFPCIALSSSLPF